MNSFEQAATKASICLVDKLATRNKQIHFNPSSLRLMLKTFDNPDLNTSNIECLNTFKNTLILHFLTIHCPENRTTNIS
ncbi:hypothetical protein Prudu_005897 [Prunus dulcis]|uniref:Uncharacterized protein n=1 Tax=Prunus dulcis TaxID=3755 RepID=A0A4Y1QYL8_PRUDU|nr:hypothetical protein Prudu_005897 [Prunus dulcis]